MRAAYLADDVHLGCSAIWVGSLCGCLRFVIVATANRSTPWRLR